MRFIIWSKLHTESAEIVKSNTLTVSYLIYQTFRWDHCQICGHAQMNIQFSWKSLARLGASTYPLLVSLVIKDALLLRTGVYRILEMAKKIFRKKKQKHRTRRLFITNRSRYCHGSRLTCGDFMLFSHRPSACVNIFLSLETVAIWAHDTNRFNGYYGFILAPVD